MRFTFKKEKDRFLKETRGIGFESIIKAILDGRLIRIINHPNRKKYPNQFIFVIDINNYAYNIPFVLSNDGFFLKTIYPSRKYTKKYLR